MSEKLASPPPSPENNPSNSKDVIRDNYLESIKNAPTNVDEVLSNPDSNESRDIIDEINQQTRNYAEAINDIHGKNISDQTIEHSYKQIIEAVNGQANDDAEAVHSLNAETASLIVGQESDPRLVLLETFAHIDSQVDSFSQAEIQDQKVMSEAIIQNLYGDRYQAYKKSEQYQLDFSPQSSSEQSSESSLDALESSSAELESEDQLPESEQYTDAQDKLARSPGLFEKIKGLFRKRSQESITKNAEEYTQDIREDVTMRANYAAENKIADLYRELMKAEQQLASAKYGSFKHRSALNRQIGLKTAIAKQNFLLDEAYSNSKNHLDLQLNQTLNGAPLDEVPNLTNEQTEILARIKQLESRRNNTKALIKDLNIQYREIAEPGKVASISDNLQKIQDSKLSAFNKEEKKRLHIRLQFDLENEKRDSQNERLIHSQAVSRFNQAHPDRNPEDDDSKDLLENITKEIKKEYTDRIKSMQATVDEYRNEFLPPVATTAEKSGSENTEDKQKTETKEAKNGKDKSNKEKDDKKAKRKKKRHHKKRSRTNHESES